MTRDELIAKADRLGPGGSASHRGQSLMKSMCCIAALSLSFACSRDPKLKQLEERVDSAQSRAHRLLAVPATPPDSLAAVLTRLRQAEKELEAYRQAHQD